MVRAEFVPAMYVMCEEFEGVECGYKDDFESCACVCFEEGKDADLWALGVAGLDWRLGPRPVRNAGPSMYS